MRLIDADQIHYEPMLSARGNGKYEDVMVAYKDEIDEVPTINEREYIEQIRWERDMAIQQLNSLGYGFGEKPKEQEQKMVFYRYEG